MCMSFACLFTIVWLLGDGECGSGSQSAGAGEAPALRDGGRVHGGAHGLPAGVARGH